MIMIIFKSAAIIMVYDTVQAPQFRLHSSASLTTQPGPYPGGVIGGYA